MSQKQFYFREFKGDEVTISFPGFRAKATKPEGLLVPQPEQHLFTQLTASTQLEYREPRASKNKSVGGVAGEITPVESTLKPPYEGTASGARELAAKLQRQQGIEIDTSPEHMQRFETPPPAPAVEVSAVEVVPPKDEKPSQAPLADFIEASETDEI